MQQRIQTLAMRNRNSIHLLLAFLVLLSFGCSNGPQPINYGEDVCDFCRMAIVDNQHAAQVVTEKGKNYKYDAIECMMNDLNKWDKPPVALHLVSDYANPGVMTDATSASYLITKEIPSPMGEFLSGFADEAKRDEVHSTSGGDTYNWDQLSTYFKENY